MGRRVRRRETAAPPPLEIQHDPRARPLARLTAHVHELTGRYVEGNADAPGLLLQLEYPRMHLAAPAEPGGKPAGKPGSTPPLRAELLDWAAAIRQDALYFAYETGWPGVDPDRALTVLPELLTSADIDLIRTAVRQMGGHVHACRVALGYVQRAMHYPDAICPFCGEHTIWCRPEEVKGWCSNPECAGDPETGDRAEWTRIALLALIQEAS